MKTILMVTVLVVMMAMSGMAAADVQTGWPMDTPNTYDGDHVLIDFENGTCGEIITSGTDMIIFENDDSYPWEYGCKYGCDRDLNIYPDGVYVINGDCAAWCGIPGGYGYISFAYGVSHVSVLASINTGLQMDAYNRNGDLIASSGLASPNLWKFGTDPVLTRISVDRKSCDISYVCIHDSGNFWVIDDLVVASISPGKSEKAHCQRSTDNEGKTPDHATEQWKPCDTDGDTTE